MGAVPNVVLLCCGSFNPVTNMHLRMFEIARDYLHKLNVCKVVGGVISPVHDDYGKKDLASSSHRCSMIKRALDSSDWIRLDSWECEQNKWNETITILRHHQDYFDSLANANVVPNKRKKIDDEKSLPKNWDKTSPIKVKLLCGADLLESFAVPNLWKDKDIEDILSRFGLVVISRSGTNPLKFIYESDILAKFQSNIHIVTEWITNEVSATKIRRALRRGESVRYLLQDSVIDYIQTHSLYGIQETKDSYPPPYELVENVDVVNHNNANTLSIPVPIHISYKEKSPVKEHRKGIRRSETLV